MLSGECDFFQGPPRFPYTPGGDVCGIVEEINEGPFAVGDWVFALFEGNGPTKGLAEYAVVAVKNAALKPKSATPIQAAALGSSALSAFWAVKRYVKQGDRVMVLGGTGGVGAHLVQLVKTLGRASYVAATTSADEPDNVVPFVGVVDRWIDYRKTEWSTAFKEEPPFDVVFDLISGRQHWENAARECLKRRGYYVTFTGDHAHFEIHSFWQGLKFTLKYLTRQLWSRVNPRLPKYVYHIGLSNDDDALDQVADLVDKGLLHVVLDPSSPVPFELGPIRDAFKLQQSRHPRGKIVVQIADH